MNKEIIIPDFLFEISWEVCNKIGGIHTVISTKAKTITGRYGDKYITIGPDVWKGDSTSHPEFLEEKIYEEWRKQAESEGFHVKTGRWNIPGKPVAILIDFASHTNEKNEIFTDLWNTYSLDSLRGQWDYIEPAIFGYVSGKVIESFVKFHQNIKDRVVAHFHEWMTGAGLLYLKKNFPHISTGFTTHATVLGRSIAGNGFPLYDNLTSYDPEEKAIEFNVVSKQSLELLSAQHADFFSTVSEITARECAHFLKKKPDVITPNGFENSFVPDKKTLSSKRKEVRAKLREVVNSLTGYESEEDALYVSISGRYEFKNKGLDVFIDSLAALNKEKNLKKKIFAFFMIPANNYGPRKDLLTGIHKTNGDLESRSVLTHFLHNPEYDPIIRSLEHQDLKNKPSDPVHVVFIPSYLNGKDGILNFDYYDVLSAMDLTVYPSYYEPWGYTPLESIAFGIPTVTTTLAGFGDWVKNNLQVKNKSITVIGRNDSNRAETSMVIKECIEDFINHNQKQIKATSEEATEISAKLLWNELADYYFKGYDLALSKLLDRNQSISELRKTEPLPEIIVKPMINNPNWTKIFVESKVPEQLAGLTEISQNLWWSWNENALELFEITDSYLWKATKNNPVQMLEEIPYVRLKDLTTNKEYMKKYDAVYKEFKDYIAETEFIRKDQIAYLSMEFGLHDSLKIFSGGLGILAGDYLKEASDARVNMVGIGLLYRYGYFTQEISRFGDQIDKMVPQRFSQIPAMPLRDKNGAILSISVAFPGRIVKVRIWQTNVGRIPLILLDTDHEENNPADRTITHHLYGGDLENRFKQEMILGVGGIRALEKAGYYPDIYHINEGHAAFCGLERIRTLIERFNLTYYEALEIVRGSSLFTTHTPVAAGHDAFEEDMVRRYMSHYPERMKISWEQFIQLGKINPIDKTERFSMSYLASNLSQEINGVSWLHGEVSKKLLNPLWNGYQPEELHIGYVTNGVHLPTWTSKNFKELYKKVLGVDSDLAISNSKTFDKIYEIPDEELWKHRLEQKTNLVNFIKDQDYENRIRRNENPNYIVKIMSTFSDKTLTIGFARRFATYKRAHLLFKNEERLAEIVNNPLRPVQFIFAGKAHPNDKAGQDLIKFIYNISLKPHFIGKIIFIENYDISLAKKLVQGVDIWMNTPTRPLEASGTSGMKAVMNGALHFSVLDGWWVEGYRKNAGWAIPEERTYSDQLLQDELDSETIYEILENEITPAFYERNENNIPVRWISFIKNSLAHVAPMFTTRRMINDYQDLFYKKLFERKDWISSDEYRNAYFIGRWKNNISLKWSEIKLLSINNPDPSSVTLNVDEPFTVKAKLDLGSISVEDVGVELVIADVTNPKQDLKIVGSADFTLTKHNGSIAEYTIDITPSKPGILNYCIRVFPSSPDLPNRQDFPLVKWL